MIWDYSGALLPKKGWEICTAGFCCLRRLPNKYRRESWGYCLSLRALWWSWALISVIAVTQLYTGETPGELRQFTEHPLSANRREHVGQNPYTNRTPNLDKQRTRNCSLV